MRTILIVVNLVLSFFLILCILIQAKGTGFGTGFVSHQPYSTKRGLERTVFLATVVLTGLFAVISVTLLVI